MIRHHVPLSSIRNSALAILLIAAPAFAQHPDVVAAVKSELQARGVDLSAPCGAFQITKRVAWRLRAEGAGLLSKPGGNNCEGYSVDYVVYLTGRGADILGDAGGANIPGWNEETDPDFVARWRPAFDPGDTPVVVGPPAAPPVILTPSTAALEALVRDLQQRLIDLQRSQDANEAAAVAFRASVKTEWQKIAPTLSFLGKYVLPAVTGWLIGKKVSRLWVPLLYLHPSNINLVHATIGVCQSGLRKQPDRAT